jgi:hypothetical protein
MSYAAFWHAETNTDKCKSCWPRKPDDFVSQLWYFCGNFVGICRSVRGWYGVVARGGRQPCGMCLAMMPSTSSLPRGG